jgi:uncharacterized protein YbjT (DUF2867 family)
MAGASPSSQKPRLVIAGASGFVGQALIPSLIDRFEVVALSRSNRLKQAGVICLPCDLFSLLQIEQALQGADYAIYLVHSMLPAKLTQASFSDMDLILADNFARAAAKAGVKQILYLGGLIPDTGDLSRHLASRLEVEHVLASRNVPVTALRAGLILGAGGSSFRIMHRLVKKLPIMLCPKWTTTRTQPISLIDVVAMIQFCLARPETFGQTYDIGGPEVMTYVEMMTRTAAELGQKVRIFTVPLLSPRLSVAWVCLISGAQRELVRPLVESLRHPMVCRSRELQERAGNQAQPFASAIAIAVKEELAGKEEKQGIREHLGRVNAVSREAGYVVSIQRLPLPKGRDAVWVAQEYARWLPRLLRFIIKVEADASFNLCFRLTGLSSPLLRLEFSADRSTPDRPLFYIRGGILAGKPVPEHHRSPARLEFRETPDRKYVMAAIFNFRPRLPWFLYRLTQAPVHLWVMTMFGRHLAQT